MCIFDLKTEMRRNMNINKSKNSSNENSSPLQSSKSRQDSKKVPKIPGDLTEEQKNEIKEAYSAFEIDGITPDELKSAMKTLGFDSNNYEVSKILDKIDTKKGPMKFEDFMDVMIEKESEKEPDDEMKKAFKVLCEEGMDKITMKSLSKICVDLGEKIDEEELQEMINQADKDQDEEISEEDFVKIMKKIGMY